MGKGMTMERHYYLKDVQPGTLFETTGGEFAVKTASTTKPEGDGEVICTSMQDGGPLHFSREIRIFPVDWSELNKLNERLEKKLDEQESAINGLQQSLDAALDAPFPEVVDIVVGDIQRRIQRHEPIQNIHELRGIIQQMLTRFDGQLREGTTISSAYFCSRLAGVLLRYLGETVPKRYREAVLESIKTWRATSMKPQEVSSET